MDDAWSAWSEWSYDEENKTMYRVRQDRYGNLDYQTSTSTPRETGGVAAITQTLETTTLSSPSSSYENPHSGLPADHTTPLCSAENYVVSSRKDKDRSSKTSKSKSKDKDKGKEKSTSKHHSHDKSSSHRKGYAGTSSSAAAPSGRGSSSTASSSKQHADLYDPSQLSIDPQTGQFFYHRRESVDSTGQESEYPTTDEQQHEVLHAVENAEASAYPPGHGLAGPADPSYSASANTYELEDDGSSTPRNHDHIAADQEEVSDTFEQMDPRYRVEHSSRFEPGSIFKVYWSEPQGSSDNHKHPSVSGKQEFHDKFGMKFHVGFRRFIVIANDQGHCTCVPILTYGSRGCRKSGVKPNKHGIVHEVGRSPRQVDGEPRLGFAPVQVQLTQDGEKLSKESRVNYSKLVTVEHNVAVFFIGSVVHASWHIVEDAVNSCWDQKVHHRRPKH